LTKDNTYRAPARRNPLLLLVLLLIFLSGSQISVLLWQGARTLHYWQNSEKRAKDTLIVKPGELQNIVRIKKDEIRFRGRMFDIRNEYRWEDKIILIGHFDSGDDVLFGWLEKLMGKEDHGRHTGKSLFWVIEAVIPGLPFPEVYTCTATIDLPDHRQTFYTDNNSLPLSPPPEGC